MIYFRLTEGLAKDRERSADQETYETSCPDLKTLMQAFSI